MIDVALVGAIFGLIVPSDDPVLSMATGIGTTLLTVFVPLLSGIQPDIGVAVFDIAIILACASTALLATHVFDCISAPVTCAATTGILIYAWSRIFLVSKLI